MQGCKGSKNAEVEERAAAAEETESEDKYKEKAPDTETPAARSNTEEGPIDDLPNRTSPLARGEGGEGDGSGAGSSSGGGSGGGGGSSSGGGGGGGSSDSRGGGDDAETQKRLVAVLARLKPAVAALGASGMLPAAEVSSLGAEIARWQMVGNDIDGAVLQGGNQGSSKGSLSPKA
eukprot:gene2881-9878_t